MNTNQEHTERKRFPTAALAAIIVVVIIAGYFVYQRYTPSGLSRTISAPSASMIGKKVTFKNAVVALAGPDDIVFWIKDRNTKERGLLVYTNFDLQSKLHIQNGNRLRDGQHINVTGTLTAEPGVDYMQNVWKLNSDDANYVKDKLVYLNAETIELVK